MCILQLFTFYFLSQQGLTRHYLILLQFFQSIVTMNCYLKISYLNRHKKYRYWKDRPINFQQIKRELLVNLAPESICYTLNNRSPAKGESIAQEAERRMNEQELGDYIKGLDLKQNETIKIKIIEDNSRTKAQNKMGQEDIDSFMLPSSMDRLRSKSEEISIETVNVEIKTDTIEVTQEFLCNSNIEFVENVKKQSEVDWIVREIEGNRRRLRMLQEKKRLTDIPSLYQKMRRTGTESDLHQYQ